MTKITQRRPNYKHGMEGTPEYRAYYSMRSRCYNPSKKEYLWYGSKGVTVCDRWMESFVNFYEDMGKRPGKEYSLDRISSNGNYEPTNCRWADWKTQENNRGSYNHKVTINGITKNIQEWCDEYDIKDTTFHNRIRRGWTGERLLERPKKERTKCARGHDFDAKNTYIDPSGCRNCRECKRISTKIRKQI